MPGARLPTIREALREETGPLVVVRMRRLLYLSITGLVLSALSDFRLTPHVPYDFILLKLAGALLQAIAVGLIAVSSRSGWQRSTTVAVGAWSLTCIVVSVNGYYTADPLMPTLLLPVMVAGAGLVFPWGTGPQVALAAVVSVSFLPHVAGLGTNLVVSAYCAFAASIYVAATFEHQLFERKAIEVLQAGQQRVLERIAADVPLSEVCAELFAAILQQVPDLQCALMLLDRETKRLRCAAAVGLPDAFRGVLEDVPVGSRTEWCAAAARSGRRVMTADIATEPIWAGVRPLALSCGLRATWSEPILAADHSVLGIIAAYRSAPRLPDRREIDLFEAAARVLGIAMERRDAREQLERYVQALDDARVQAEQQARQLQEQAHQLAAARDLALASARARSQFLANMSHEIRTPLNGIIGTTEILLDSELTSEQREFARILSQCGDHLLHVINDILDLSKIEAGKVEIDRVALDLRALVEEVADVFAVRAQEKGLELITFIPPDLDGSVLGDPPRLRQVLVNLVGNAIKFTERGEIVLEVQRLDAAPSRHTVRLSVRDTGIGIPLERQVAVFESFTQADGSTTRTYGGSGLGLTISKELVRLMDGHIDLDSTPGTGSTFRVDLPLERAPAAAALLRAAPSRLARLHVLVVDDTATNRLILRRSLEAWGCRVTEAASGGTALAQLECSATGDAFDLVLLDMRMPDLDGIETARRITADPRFAPVPLILLSSIGGLRGGTRAARQVGFASVVTKPVRQSALLDAMLSALGEQASEPERRPGTAVAASADARVLRVLLAEDNRINQLVAQRLLQKLGCQTDVVENGRDAVEAVTRHRYDIILMDIQMPVMDGFEATTRIRDAETAGARLPIVAMTAHAMEGDRDRCLAAGMDGYISKPVNLAALGKVLAGLHRDASPADCAPLAPAATAAELPPSPDSLN